MIWENRQYGSIVWKQDKQLRPPLRHRLRATRTSSSLADAFGMPAWRIEAVDDFGPTLRRALDLDVPSLIVLPIDYSVDVAISEELGTETVAA